MGTNFYAEIDKCAHCGRGADRLHIGKQSSGWPFHFMAHESGPKSFVEWVRFLSGADCLIVNEYGGTVPFDELLAMIESTRAVKSIHHDDTRQDRDGYRFSDREFS